MHAPVGQIVREECFVEYDVPLKSGKKEKLWAISWPYKFWDDSSKKDGNKEGPESELDRLFREALIPCIPESKRLNSAEFFKWYGRKVYPNLNIANIEEAK